MTVLSKKQRQILKLMHRHGATQFFGQTREFYWRVNPDGGVLIRAYQNPEYFLAARKLIAKTPSNLQGTWYRLTEEGRRIAAQIAD